MWIDILFDFGYLLVLISESYHLYHTCFLQDRKRKKCGMRLYDSKHHPCHYAGRIYGSLSNIERWRVRVGQRMLAKNKTRSGMNTFVDLFRHSTMQASPHATRGVGHGLEWRAKNTRRILKS